MAGKTRAILVLMLTACWVGPPAGAGMVDIGGNWQASWDPSLDSYVSIGAKGVVNDAVYIEKSAEFIQPPVNGIFPSIAVVFRQTGPSTVTDIVIDDEIITNSTGVDWTDFHFEVLNGPDAKFDPVATGGSGGDLPIGWTIAPFTQAAFTADLLELNVWGGVVPAGGLWFPGDGATNGQLWIDVVSKHNLPYTVFTLKETPTPEPIAVSLFVLSGVVLLRRRRK
jgi:hypothetical protein